MIQKVNTGINKDFKSELGVKRIRNFFTAYESLNMNGKVVPGRFYDICVLLYWTTTCLYSQAIIKYTHTYIHTQKRTAFKVY